MPLEVVTQPDFISATSFRFVVPGHQQWRLRTVHVTVARAIGGAPNRDYVLTITDGTSTVWQGGANDAGTEPGTCTVTWCQAPASATAAGATGIVVAPMPALALEAGYTIVGVIENPAVGDTFGAPVVWCDFAYTD